MASHTVDTSWLYALYDEADVHHDDALQQAQADGEFVVPSEVLAEVLALRAFRAPRDKHRAARRLCDAILSAGFRIENAQVAAASLALYRRTTNLSYVDCVVVEAARRNTLLTFDARQRRA